MKDGIYTVKTTRFGFEWGPVTIERITEDKNAVYIHISTKNQQMEIRITKGGKIQPGEVEKI